MLPLHKYHVAICNQREKLPQSFLNYNVKKAKRCLFFAGNFLTLSVFHNPLHCLVIVDMRENVCGLRGHRNLFSVEYHSEDQDDESSYI